MASAATREMLANSKSSASDSDLPHWLSADNRSDRILGDGGMAVPHEQRSLKGEGDVLGDLAGPVLDGVEILELRPQAVDVGVQPRVVAAVSASSSKSTSTHSGRAGLPWRATCPAR